MRKRTGFCGMMLVGCVLITGLAAAGQDQQKQQPDVPLPPLSDETVADVQRVVMVFKQVAMQGDPQVRAIAVASLARFLEHDESILDVLLECSHADEAAVKRAAITALSNIEDPTSQVIDALLAVLGDESLSHDDIGQLQDALHARGAYSVIPRAAAALESGPLNGRIRVIELLVRFRHEARDAVDPLLALAANSPSESTPDEAAQLQTAALSAVATIMSHAAEREAAVRAKQHLIEHCTDATLESYDGDGNGVIAEQEAALYRDKSRRFIKIQIDYTRFTAEPDEMDINGDNAVDREELSAVVEVLVLGLDPEYCALVQSSAASLWAASMILHHDQDNDGVIGIKEAPEIWVGDMRGRLIRDEFGRFDLDGSHFVTHAELVEVAEGYISEVARN